MDNHDLIAALDQCIAVFEEYRKQETSEYTAAHGQSSLSTPEEALDDPDIKFIGDAIDDLHYLRKKVEK